MEFELESPIFSEETAARLLSHEDFRGQLKCRPDELAWILLNITEHPGLNLMNSELKNAIQLLIDSAWSDVNLDPLMVRSDGSDLIAVTAAELGSRWICQAWLALGTERAANFCSEVVVMVEVRTKIL